MLLLEVSKRVLTSYCYFKFQLNILYVFDVEITENTESENNSKRLKWHPCKKMYFKYKNECVHSEPRFFPIFFFIDLKIR